MDRREFREAEAGLRNAHQSGASLCVPFVRAMPGTSVALSTIGASFGHETLCASDAVAGRLDELQIDLGEGPSWQSIREHRPVLAADLHATPSAWPVFAKATQGMTTRSAFAFPLAVGVVELGALGLYADEAETLTRHDIESVSALAAIAATQVLRRTFARMDSASKEPYSRREVHQATGMVVAQLQVPATEALLIIQAHAFAAGSTVRALAAEILARRIDLSDA